MTHAEVLAQLHNIQVQMDFERDGVSSAYLQNVIDRIRARPEVRPSGDAASVQADQSER